MGADDFHVSAEWFDKRVKVPLDPPEKKIAAYCQGCEFEIWEGEEVYVVEGDILHHDDECLIKYTNPKVMAVEEALNSGSL